MFRLSFWYTAAVLQKLIYPVVPINPLLLTARAPHTRFPTYHSFPLPSIVISVRPRRSVYSRRNCTTFSVSFRSRNYKVNCPQTEDNPTESFSAVGSVIVGWRVCSRVLKLCLVSIFESLIPLSYTHCSSWSLRSRVTRQNAAMRCRRKLRFGGGQHKTERFQAHCCPLCSLWVLLWGREKCYSAMFSEKSKIYPRIG